MTAAFVNAALFICTYAKLSGGTLEHVQST